MEVVEKISWRQILPAALLVAGNLLGVGILALPIKVGISGFLPSLIDILIICSLMVISAFVIASRLSPEKSNFDLPSFFHQELGVFGYWIATICNLILLYGVLVVYLSAISSIVANIFPIAVSEQLVTVLYFLFATSLIMFGRKVLKQGNVILLIAIFICFIVLVKTGVKDFNSTLLSYTNWKYLPLGLPVVVSAFHFHNIIPTVARYVNHDQKSIRKVILTGVGIGLVMNLIWVLVILGSLAPAMGQNSIMDTFVAGLPATIPMTHLLHSHIFTMAGFIFAALAATASYVANGTGLFGFMRDLTYTYFKTSNKIIVGTLAFAVPLIITLIYPQAFLAAVDIVGGIGEAILFILLPGLILIRLQENKNKIWTSIGYFMVFVGLFVFIFIAAQKLGIINYHFVIRRA